MVEEEVPEEEQKMLFEEKAGEEELQMKRREPCRLSDFPKHGYDSTTH